MWSSGQADIQASRKVSPGSVKRRLWAIRQTRRGMRKPEWSVAFYGGQASQPARPAELPAWRPKCPPPSRPGVELPWARNPPDGASSRRTARGVPLECGAGHRFGLEREWASEAEGTSGVLVGFDPKRRKPPHSTGATEGTRRATFATAPRSCLPRATLRAPHSQRALPSAATGIGGTDPWPPNLRLPLFCAVKAGDFD